MAIVAVALVAVAIVAVAQVAETRAETLLHQLLAQSIITLPAVENYTSEYRSGG